MRRFNLLYVSTLVLIVLSFVGSLIYKRNERQKSKYIEGTLRSKTSIL